jgi:Fe-S-cluster containining protein
LAEEDKIRFEAAVREAMSRDRLPFIIALYKVVDQMTDQGVQNEEVKPVCSTGCGICCHQLVGCTDLEWNPIVHFLLTLPEKEKYWFRRRVKPLLVQLRRYFDRNPKIFQYRIRDPIREWQGTPCPFLTQQMACLIYPVRPIDCRTMSSTNVCTVWDELPGVKRMRFPWEKWANNWILEEQARILEIALHSVPVHLMLDRLNGAPKLWQ